MQSALRSPETAVQVFDDAHSTDPHRKSSLDGEADEHSPLLAATDGPSEEQPRNIANLNSGSASNTDSSWDPEGELSTSESKSSWFLFLLTVSLGGLQLAWAVELSNGSPYLLSLGLSKSLLALVWIAGPLTGALVQPYIGIRSDQCRSRFGKRRPFIMGGAVSTVISLFALAWAREIIGTILSLFGFQYSDPSVGTTSIVFAVVMVYVLDFSINMIQAAIRAFIVDNAPAHQQDSANAWASRLSNVGNIILYMFGYVDLPRYFWFFGDTQFKVLCVIASLGLMLTTIASCVSIKERDPRLDAKSSNSKGGILTFFRQLFQSVRYLPRQISRICQVQLAAWVGWFPFLFYATTYMGEIYVDPIFRENPNMSPEEIDKVWERGTRVGTLALMIFAITSFAASVIIPWFVVNPYRNHESMARTRLTRNATRLASSGASQGSTACGGGPTQSISSPRQGSVQARVWSWSKIDLTIPGLTLRRAWFLSHIFFALLTWLTLVARSTIAATVLVAFVGIPWSITMWAPFALIAADIRKHELERPNNPRTRQQSVSGADGSDELPETGLILGIHNVAVSAPQVFATLISSAIFRALQKPRGTPGDGSVAWVLRFGGLCALVAALLTLRVGEQEVPSSEEEEV